MSPTTSQLPPSALFPSRLANLVIPSRCQWPADLSSTPPPPFTLTLNLLFGLAAMVTVADLYYNHPLLDILSRDFGVSYQEAARVPTLMQAGYACGLVLVCPAGDVVRRRGLVLTLVFGTASLWIVLCVTMSFPVFVGVSFVVGVTTVTPQLMMPLVGDLAAPQRRAAAVSIVTSGLVSGILFARVLSGLMANYTSWRNVYWLAMGLQYLVWILLWYCMPNYPATNSGGDLTYFRALWSIPVLLMEHAVVVQACLVGFFTATTFTSFWTTLTALLSGSPYHYSPLVIGLFGLIGLFAISMAPIYARLVTDRFVPLFSVVVGEIFCLAGVCIGTFTGRFSVAGPVLQAALVDFGLQTAQIANRSAIYSAAPLARNRINTLFMLSVFCGQLVGTSAGNAIYARAGWIGSGGASVAAIVIALAICAARGPWEESWVGWRGGWRLRKKDPDSADGKIAGESVTSKPDGDPVGLNMTQRNGSQLSNIRTTDE